MTKAILAAAAATAIFAAIPLLVGSTPAHSQAVEIGPGGVRVDPDGRRDRDRRDYRRGRGDRCVTEYTTRTTPSGRTIREKKTVCR